MTMYSIIFHNDYVVILLDDYRSYNILYDYMLCHFATWLYIFSITSYITTFSMIFLWLHFLYYIYDYVFCNIFMTTFSTTLLWLRVLWAFLWLCFLYYLYNYVFVILYMNTILDNHIKTSSTYIISSFTPASSSCLNKCTVVPAFIGSDGLNNNNTNRSEIWK